MSTSSRIRQINISPLDIPLHAPFGISGGAQAAANNVLVTVELEGGVQGYGEAAPLPPYNGETQSDALTALNSVREQVIGRDASQWQEVGAEFAAGARPRSGSARCALEMALLDAWAKDQRQPLWKVFGGRGTTLETDMTVTTGGADEARRDAREIRARGIRLIKVKVGGPRGPAHDIARILAIRAEAPDAPLILDGNAGLSRADAAELAGGLRRENVTPALLEQWLAKDDLSGMCALAAETSWPVAADESVTTREDALRVIQARAAQFINIKLMKAGIGAALEVMAVAKKAGLGLMIGGNIESILAMTTSACFAAGAGGFTYADLDTPLFLRENPFIGGFELSGGTISVAHIGAGHGVVPK